MNKTLNMNFIMTIKQILFCLISLILLLPACKKEKEAIPVSLSKKVIIDTDADADDAMAISYLLHAKGIEVIGITVTGTGFMLQEQGVPVILKLLAMNGKPTIPVSYGASTAIVPFSGFPDEWRTSALKFYDHAGLPSITVPPDPFTSAELIIRLVRNSSGKVIILGLGPMTNIALALQMDPSITGNIEQIIMSAGAFAPHKGDIVTFTPQTVIEETASYKAQAALSEENNSAEYNVILDAAAFSAILRSGVNVLISPLNASERAQITQSVLDPLKNVDTPTAKFIVGVIQPMVSEPNPSYFWDPVAASLIVDPSVCTDKQRVKVTVDIDTDSAYGTTVISQYGNEVEVCFDIDSLRFYQSFVQTFIESD